MAALRAQTRPADELWVLTEDYGDYSAVIDTWLAGGLPASVHFRDVNVPRDDAGRPTIIPPSLGINAVLDESKADYIAYLTDDSLPHPEKYERMVAALDGGAKAVYCAQGYGKAPSQEEWLDRIEKPSDFRHAGVPTEDPFCKVDHTQVAHVRTDARWPTDLSHMRWADGTFFRDLVTRYGPLQPIGEVLDFTCQMPDGITSRW